MEYRIVLRRMEFRALHGCYELERKVGNRFTVDLEITAELGDVAAEDIIEAVYAAFGQVRHVKCTVSKRAPPLGGKLERVSVVLEK